MPAVLLLLSAIIFEVTGTVFMKFSDGFTYLWPSVFMIITYAISFASLTLCIRRMEISVAYAVWSALGTVLISLIGIVFFNESITWAKGLCLLLIILGVAGLSDA